MKLTAQVLELILEDQLIDAEIRIADVSEGHDLHVSVGEVVVRNGCIVLVPGDDDIWKDETLSSEVHMKQLWPEEEKNED